MAWNHMLCGPALKNSTLWVFCRDSSGYCVHCCHQYCVSGESMFCPVVERHGCCRGGGEQNMMMLFRQPSLSCLYWNARSGHPEAKWVVSLLLGTSLRKWLKNHIWNSSLSIHPLPMPCMVPGSSPTGRLFCKCFPSNSAIGGSTLGRWIPGEPFISLSLLILLLPQQGSSAPQTTACPNKLKPSACLSDWNVEQACKHRHSYPEVNTWQPDAQQLNLLLYSVASHTWSLTGNYKLRAIQECLAHIREYAVSEDCSLPRITHFRYFSTVHLHCVHMTDWLLGYLVFNALLPAGAKRGMRAMLMWLSLAQRPSTSLWVSVCCKQMDWTVGIWGRLITNRIFWA